MNQKGIDFTVKLRQNEITGKVRYLTQTILLQAGKFIPCWIIFAKIAFAVADFPDRTDQGSCQTILNTITFIPYTTAGKLRFDNDSGVKVYSGYSRGNQ